MNSLLKALLTALVFGSVPIELELLAKIRNELDKDLIIRLDANGAFLPKEALKKLDELAEFNIHSIEQPIKPGQWELMSELCTSSPIPIAPFPG